jgi:hypothetical protein
VLQIDGIYAASAAFEFLHWIKFGFKLTLTFSDAIIGVFGELVCVEFFSLPSFFLFIKHELQVDRLMWQLRTVL